MSNLSDERVHLDFKTGFIDHIIARERFLAQAEITIERHKFYMEKENAFWARLKRQTDGMTAVVEEMESIAKTAAPVKTQAPADTSLPSLVERLEAAVKALEARS
jgi:hypothetical protein